MNLTFFDIRVCVRYGLLLAAALLLAACGDAPSTTRCGGAGSTAVTPPPPDIGDMPLRTSRTTFTVSGRRAADTAIHVDGVEALPASCDRFWTLTLDLPNEGANSFTLSALSFGGNRSTDVPLTIIRDTAPPAAPAITAPLDGFTTSLGTATVTGGRESGARVLLNGEPLVPAEPSITFSASVALADGANVLNFTQVDPAGNVSPVTPLNVTRTGAHPPAPRTIQPMDRERTALAPQLLIWQVVVDPSVAEYLVEVSTRPDFSTIAQSSILPATDPPWITFTPAAPRSYYWRVATRDAAGEANFGPVRAFRADTLPGDVNGDGYSDIIAGAAGYDGGKHVTSQDNRGQVKLFLGGTTLGDAATETVDQLFDGQVPGAKFGTSVTTGDLNGDGYHDVIAGAYHESATERTSGAAHVFFGGPAPDATADLSLAGQNSGDEFGVKVVSGFDLNGDGFDDLAVGAWKYDDPDQTSGDNRGRIYLFFGGISPDGTPDLILTGGEPLENLGAWIAGGLDINGDGFDDLVAGGPNADVPAMPDPIVDAGRVLVYYGGPDVDDVPDLILYGQLADEHFGEALAGGDMDGDGFDDLFVGAPNYDAGPTLTMGRGFLFTGGTAPSDIPALTFYGAGQFEAFGMKADGGGDLNRDGYADLAVGVPYSDLGGSGAPTDGDLGMVEIHLGGPSPDTTPDARFFGEANRDQLGMSVHLTGDTNGDGAPDLLFGAPNNDLGSSIYGDVGRGYVLFGGIGIGTPYEQSASAIGIAAGGTVPGALLPNNGGKDGLGSSIW